MVSEGRFQVYTGNGKGKTTAALGLAVRAACAGYRVFIGQFLKGRESSELALQERFDGRIVISLLGRPGFVTGDGDPDPADIAAAVEGLARLREALASGEYDVVIADELCVAAHFGLVSRREVLSLVDARPGNVELVVTGRDAPDYLLKRADLVTEMRELRHYYSTEGLEARRGIEF